MGREETVSAERKLLAVQEYLSGAKSTAQINNELHIGSKTFRRWLIKYETQGAQGIAI